jgi:RNA polymerase sigma factor (sigma-70 family)
VLASLDLDRAYRAHAPAVFRRARRILGSVDEAEEVVSEIFEALAADASSLLRADSPAGWFYATSTNRCLNRIRYGKNRLRILQSHADVPPPPVSAEDSAALRQLLSRLPEELARVAVYYYADEMTHEEIARLLGCSRRHVGDLVERLHESVGEKEHA